MFTKPQANKFISTITASPHLGAYVRELELRLGGQHQDWIYTVTRDLPSPLVNLDHLVYEEIPVLHPLFFNFSPRFDTVASLTLKYMKAWSFRDIVRLLNGCSNLEKLTVHRCEWRSPSPFYYRAPKWTEYMRPIPSSFHLDCPGLDGAYASDFLRWLVRRHETDPLHEFLFQCDRLPIRSRHLHDLVHQSSRTLTSLELRFDPVDEDSDHEAPEHDKSWLTAIASCINLRNFGMMLSSPETTSWLLGSLSSALPGSLCNFALHFWDYDSERIFLDEKARDLQEILS
ncbi:hypothetical protein NLI96_g7807 [Meripilus lineatus]|uniref:Uncharacterized protein n=1 Tax=Meripilus lineatus TaxID=2056292 RepID=A0AAD5UYI4_9APHY|nr:hypothetical protein NLI96_g7807 [Physisporinus lineatus]